MSEEIDNDWRYRPDFPVDYPPEVVLEDLLNEIYRPLMTIKGCRNLLSESGVDLQPAVITLLDGSTQKIEVIMNRVLRYLEAYKSRKSDEGEP
jgi:hypothetical protein